MRTGIFSLIIKEELDQKDIQRVITEDGGGENKEKRDRSPPFMMEIESQCSCEIWRVIMALGGTCCINYSKLGTGRKQQLSPQDDDGTKSRSSFNFLPSRLYWKSFWCHIFADFTSGTEILQLHKVSVWIYPGNRDAHHTLCSEVQPGIFWGRMKFGELKLMWAAHNCFMFTAYLCAKHYAKHSTGITLSVQRSHQPHEHGTTISLILGFRLGEVNLLAQDHRDWYCSFRVSSEAADPSISLTLFISRPDSHKGKWPQPQLLQQKLLILWQLLILWGGEAGDAREEG